MRACLAASHIVSGLLKSIGSTATSCAPEHNPATRVSSLSRLDDKISRHWRCANRRASASPIPLDAPVPKPTFRGNSFRGGERNTHRVRNIFGKGLSYEEPATRRARFGLVILTPKFSESKRSVSLPQV